MISAELYVADKLKNRTIVELEREKTKLKNKIEELTILQQNDSSSIMIHPSPETKKNMYIEYINEIDKKIEWKKLLTDVKVVKIMINNYIYLITPDLIRYQKAQENNITDIQKEDISSSDFNFFVNTALERLYSWNEEYIDEKKSDIISWEIDLTLQNGDIKKFIGKGQYPYNWSDFYNDFFLFVERSDVQSYDVAIIKAAIYYTLATQMEDSWRIIDCKNLIKATDFQQKIEQLPVKHPCRINFNYTKTLNNNLYKKAIIETTHILDTFIETNFEESCKILSSIDSETAVDNVVNRIMENYKEFEKEQKSRNKLPEQNIKKTISNDNIKENEITEILIVIENDKYRIKPNEIKQFVDGIKYVGKKQIEIDQFKNISNVVLNYTNNWDKYFTKFIPNEVNWKIQIKTGESSKRYSGTDYPENWKEFYNEIMFVIKGTKEKLEPNFDAVELDDIFLNESEESEEDNIETDNLQEQKIIKINNEYKNNGITFALVSLINDFVVNSIEDDEVDIFWSDSARRLLGLGIVANLLNNNQLSISLLIEQIKDSSKLQEVIRGNLNEITANEQLNEFSEIVRMLDSDKPLKSVLEIIEKSLLKLDSKNVQEEQERNLKNVALKKINEMVDAGDAEAINELAYRYFYGEGIEKNQEKAFELWANASLMGNIKATYNVALCFLNGEGTYKDEKQAFNILNRLANEKGHIKSIFYLGEIYHFGLGVDVDYEKAMFYYKETLKKDPHNLRAKYCIAYAYYAGTGVEKSYEQAYKMFYDLVHKDNYEEAAFHLGECYYLGRSVQQDYQKAFEYFNRALNSDKVYSSNIYNSKFYLGEMYLLGNGVNFDCQKAKEYFEDIINEKKDDVYYKLALIYLGKYGTYKDEKKAKEYFEKIEIDLCIALIYYLLALRPEEEQNLNKMFELLNSEMDLFQYMLKQIPYKHPAREYHRRLAHLRNEEYDDIVNRLKAKIDKCRTDNKFLEVPKTFVSDEDVIFYATCIVKSYEYPSIDSYIRELLQKKDDAALIFVGKLFINGDFVEKNIKKGLEYLFISKKQNPEISKENRDSCIVHIETTTNDPEIKLLIGKRYLEIPYYKKQGIELIQEAASQGCMEATEIITNVLQEMRKEYKSKYPEDEEYECLFEIEKLTKDPKIQSFLVDYSEDDIRESKEYENFVKMRCLQFIKMYANTGYEVAQNFLNNKMQQIKNSFKVTKELAEEELEFIYNYSMNDYEKEKIKELNLQEKINLLKTDDRQIEFWNNSIKYIEDLGYMVIQWIYYWGEGGCSQSGGNTKYFTKVEPTLDFDTAKAEITKVVDEALKERNITGNKKNDIAKKAVLRFSRDYALYDTETQNYVTYDKTENEYEVIENSTLTIQGNNCSTDITVKKIDSQYVELELNDSMLIGETLDGKITLKIDKGNTYDYVLPSTYHLQIKVIEIF